MLTLSQCKGLYKDPDIQHLAQMLGGDFLLLDFDISNAHSLIILQMGRELGFTDVQLKPIVDYCTPEGRILMLKQIMTTMGVHWSYAKTLPLAAINTGGLVPEGKTQYSRGVKAQWSSQRVKDDENLRIYVDFHTIVKDVTSRALVASEKFMMDGKLNPDYDERFHVPNWDKKKKQYLTELEHRKIYGLDTETMKHNLGASKVNYMLTIRERASLVVLIHEGSIQIPKPWPCKSPQHDGAMLLIPNDLWKKVQGYKDESFQQKLTNFCDTVSRKASRRLQDHLGYADRMILSSKTGKMVLNPFFGGPVNTESGERDDHDWTPDGGWRDVSGNDMLKFTVKPLEPKRNRSGRMGLEADPDNAQFFAALDYLKDNGWVFREWPKVEGELGRTLQDRDEWSTANQTRMWYQEQHGECFKIPGELPHKVTLRDFGVM